MPHDVPYEDLRSALLFYDKFDVPCVARVDGPNQIIDQLKAVDLLVSSELSGTGELSSYLKYAPVKAFEARDVLEPGRWTLARPVNAIGFPEDALSPSTAAALTLQNALPVFTREVPLDDILEFKRRARAELDALRSHLDDVGYRIARNGTSDIESSAEFQRFISSLNAHMQLMNESNRAKVVRAFRASFDLTDLIGPGAIVAWTKEIDMKAVVAGAITIGVKAVSGLRRKRDHAVPFEYLTSAQLEL